MNTSLARYAVAFGLLAVLVGCASVPPPVAPLPETTPAPLPPAKPEPPPIEHLSPDTVDAELLARRQRLVASGAEHVPANEVGYYMDLQQARLQQLGNGRLQVNRVGDSIRLTLIGSPHFEVSSSTLTSEAKSTLALVAGTLAEYRLSLVSVHGHTDNSGTVELNRQISLQRATAVARFLMNNGVARQRLLAVGHGPSKPVADNQTEDGRNRNRRVELRLDPIAE